MICIYRQNLYSEGIFIYLQRETVVAWSRSTGKPFHNAILWHDSRTSDMVSRFKKKVGRDRVEYMTGLPMSTYFSATKILWLMENVPSVRQAFKEEGQLDNSICIIWKIISNYRAWTVMKWISKDLSVVETFIFFQNLDTPAFEQSSCIHNHHVLTTGWFFPHFYVSRYFSRNYTSWVEGKKQLYRCFQIFVAYLFLEPNSKSSVEFKLDFPSIHH